MKESMELTALIANVMTIFASGIAIYIFLFKRKLISGVFTVLVSYATQLTLSELKGKLDRLNDFRAETDQDEVVNVLHDICGQLKGNPRLAPHFEELIKRIHKATTAKNKISEPTKRSIVSEIREKIRHVDILTLEQISEEKK